MSDERLRELERRVKASPEDFAVVHELVRALERAGDPRRAHAELSRLARRRDTEARRRLAERAPPRPSASVQGARSGLDPARESRIAQRLVPFRGEWHLRGATDELLFVEIGVRLHAIDTRTLEVRWRQLDAATSALVLDGTVLTLGAGKLTVHDPATGLARAERPASRVVAFAGEADRIALIEGADATARLVVRDTADAKEVWSQPLADRGTNLGVAAGRLALLARHPLRQLSTLTIFELETGERILEREFEPDAARWIAMDSVSVLLSWQERFIEFDLETGSDLRYDGEVRPCLEACLTEERAVLLRAGALEAVSRSTGRSAWRAKFAGLQRGGETVVAGDHAWSARALTDEDAVELTAHELGTGLDVRRQRVEVREGARKWPHLVPLEGAMLVLTGTQDRLVVVRLERA